MSEFDLWLRKDDLRYRNRGEHGEGAARLKLLREGAIAATTSASATVFLSMESALGFPVTVPARNRRQLIKALPFAVEDRLASDVESAHIAHGELDLSAPTPVRVVERELLRAALEEAKSFQLSAERAVLDADALRIDTRDIVILLVDDRALLKDRLGRVAAVARPALGILLGAMGRNFRTSDENAPLAVRVIYAEGANLSDLERVQLEQETRSELELLRVESIWDAFDAGTAVDLLQGEFAVKRDTGLSLGAFRNVAIAAALLLSVFLVVEVAKGVWYDRHASAVTADSEALYRELSPSTQNIVNLRQQFQDLLGGAAGTSPRAMMVSLATGIGGQNGFQLESVTYSSERNELAVQLMAPSLGSLDELKARLQSSNQNAEINSAEQVGDGVRARIKLGASG